MTLDTLGANRSRNGRFLTQRAWQMDLFKKFESFEGKPIEAMQKVLGRVDMGDFEKNSAQTFNTVCLLAFAEEVMGDRKSQVVDRIPKVFRAIACEEGEIYDFMVEPCVRFNIDDPWGGVRLALIGVDGNGYMTGNYFLKNADEEVSLLGGNHNLNLREIIDCITKDSS